MKPHKKLKFLVDVGVGQKVERWLSDNGYNTKNVRDLDPRMLDKHILKIAVAEKRMVITMDKDFGELVYNSGLPHGGVLLLRIEDANLSPYRFRLPVLPGGPLLSPASPGEVLEHHEGAKHHHGWKQPFKGD